MDSKTFFSKIGQTPLHEDVALSFFYHKKVTVDGILTDLKRTDKYKKSGISRKRIIEVLKYYEGINFIEKKGDYYKAVPNFVEDVKIDMDLASSK